MQDEEVYHAYSKGHICPCNYKVIWCTITYLCQSDRAKVNCCNESMEVFFQSLLFFHLDFLDFKEVFDLRKFPQSHPDGG